MTSQVEVARRYELDYTGLSCRFDATPGQAVLRPAVLRALRASEDNVRFSFGVEPNRETLRVGAWKFELLGLADGGVFSRAAAVR